MDPSFICHFCLSPSIFYLQILRSGCVMNSVQELCYYSTLKRLSRLYSFKVSINFPLYRLMKIKEWIDANDPGAQVILFSGALESKLLDLQTEEERETLLKELSCTRSAHQCWFWCFSILVLLPDLSIGINQY